MSFIFKALGNLFGMDAKAPPPPAAAPVAPTVTNSQDALDTASQTAARSMAGGKTSTMLNGGAGVDDTKNTSKILLGQ
jgi:hypothetical protein